MLLFCVIIGRFVYIAQGKEVQGNDLVKMGKNESTEYKTVDAHRGTIYGKGGQVLAHDIPAYTVTAVLSDKAPSHVKNKDKTASLLAPILNMKKSQILALLNRDSFQVELGPGGKKVDYDTKKKIDALHLPGLVYMPESKRYYPNQEFASYTVGFTTNDPKTNKQTGSLGIEKSLNDYLTEQDGEVSFKRSKQGVLMSKEKTVSKPKQGDDVHLTLDNKIQTVLDEAMSKVEKDYKPKRMIGIVENPKTGEILAMSNRPSFNPNKRDITNYTNYAISSPYEPGSVMKMFTLAGAINDGVFNGNETYKSGSYKVGGITIHDWQRDWGTITFKEGLERSSNVGFSIIADKKLGTDRLHDYLNAFGFLNKTGIDLPNESNSHVSYKWKSDQVSTAFGQASAFTAIQMVQAASAIANDGKMMKPYVIQKVVNPNTDKVVLNHHSEVAGKPITKETAQKTRDLLRTVVNGKHGTGHIYNLPGYNVIGKTGTAQLAVNGHYLTGKNNYIFSFLGMAPQKDPKLLVYVAVDRPNLKPTDTGSEPVAAIFNPVMSNGLQYMDVKPSAAKKASDKSETLTLSDYQGQSVQSTAASLKEKGLDVTVIGNQGNVSAQAPFAGTKLMKGSKVILKGDGKEKMPDVTGWSLSDFLKLSDILNIKPSIIGSGFVSKQKPAKGTEIKTGDPLIVNLQESPKPDDNKSKKQID